MGKIKTNILEHGINKTSKTTAEGSAGQANCRVANMTPSQLKAAEVIENCIGSRPPSDPTTKNHPNERFLDIACPEVWIVHLTSGLRPRHQKLHGLKATLKHVEEHPLEYLV